MNEIAFGYKKYTTAIDLVNEYMRENETLIITDRILQMDKPFICATYDLEQNRLTEPTFMSLAIIRFVQEVGEETILQHFQVEVEPDENYDSEG